MKREIIGVLLAAFTLSACHEKGDIYDPNYNPDFGVSVPDDFDWSTTKTLTVNVEVDDQYNGKYYYAVRVYDKVPNEGVLPVAASGEVTRDMPFSREIVVSSDVTKLYIVQSFKNANATENVVTKEVAIDSNVITYSFKSTGKSVRTAIARDDDKRTLITRADQIKANGKYLIRKGVMISVDKVNGNLTDVEIKVEGELVFTGNNEKLSGWKIEVDDEDDGIGKLRATNGLTLDGKCVLDNDGEVYISGDLKVESGAKLKNDGCIIVEGVAHIQSHIELEEKSYMYCRSMQLGGNGGNNVYIYMETGAWLKIEGSLQMNSGAKIGYGEYNKFEKPDNDEYVSDTKYVALIQVGNWQNGNSGNLTVGSEILVESPSKIDGILSWTQDASDFFKKFPSVVCSGKGGEEIKMLLGKYTYIMEDQYPNKGDYDMNDVVISMTSKQKGKKLEIEGKLRAAGANYTIVPYIQVGNETQPLFKDKKSVYKALTGKDDLPSPVNTNISGIRDCKSATFKCTFKDVKPELNQKDIDLYIMVNGTTKINMNSNKNPDAWVMCISGLDFQYPLEGVNIEEAYPNFKEWFTGSTSWYKNPVSGKVMEEEE